LKLVQERAGNLQEAICLSKDFLRRTSGSQKLREKIDKWDYIKLKILCTKIKMVFKLKRPPTEWEKIFVSYTSNMELIRIHRARKTKLPSEKMGKRTEQSLFKGTVHIAKKHMKKCSPSLAIKEMQIKTTLRFHLTPVRPVWATQ
jgi:hypothetical protein